MQIQLKNTYHLKSHTSMLVELVLDDEPDSTALELLVIAEAGACKSVTRTCEPTRVPEATVDLLLARPVVSSGSGKL